MCLAYQSGSSSGKVWDYSKQFDGELANFNAGYEIKNVIKEDLYLVQFHSNAEVGSGRSLKYWTTFDAANRISTVDDYMNQMALLSNWEQEIMCLLLNNRQEQKLNMQLELQRNKLEQ